MVTHMHADLTRYFGCRYVRGILFAESCGSRADLVAGARKYVARGRTTSRASASGRGTQHALWTATRVSPSDTEQCYSQGAPKIAMLLTMTTQRPRAAMGTRPGIGQPYRDWPSRQLERSTVGRLNLELHKTSIT